MYWVSHCPQSSEIIFVVCTPTCNHAGRELAHTFCLQLLIALFHTPSRRFSSFAHWITQSCTWRHSESRLLIQEEVPRDRDGLRSVGGPAHTHTHQLSLSMCVLYAHARRSCTSPAFLFLFSSFYNELINNIKHVNRVHHHLWLAGPVRRCLRYYASYRAGSTRVRAYYPGD